MLICPSCTSGKIVKNGKTYYGKQNHKCKDCNRQFVANNQHSITDQRREDVSALLLERISLRGICRSMGVSLTWLMSYAVSVWSETPEDLGVGCSVC
ncbi:IS1 family transposase [Neolewinella aurantiaca]|uniref:IS1 family transposase n=1 Tax=Neolewinella aurantiaca TaxID=2602767 RepID=A0A5C7FB55_9BACT|nr:IS1 family transposase [Neolewinella aurantiaca]